MSQPAETGTGSASPADERERLLRFLYLCPVGIIEVDRTGRVNLINALASQLLMPFALGGELENLLDVLEAHAPSLREAIASPRGPSWTDHRVHIAPPASRAKPITLSITVIHVDEGVVMVSVADHTLLEARETEARAALEQDSVSRGRLELASTLLHDISNAMTGVGTRASRLAADVDWPERESLRRLEVLLASRESALSDVFGAGKGPAITALIRTLEAAVAARHSEWNEAMQLFLRTIAHVQQIISVQRTLVRADSKALRSTVDVASWIDDALVLQSARLERHGIHVTRDVPRGLPVVQGDRTRLTQVLVNVLANACDSFEEARPTSPSLSVAAAHVGDQLVLTVTDNGCGFGADVADRLFQRGETTKETGSGIGLASSRETILAHSGTMELTSEGPGKGAIATIRLPAGDGKGPRR
jgi:signal transduction histidine kinase